jgi:outer membrane protein assembly factor BamB
MRVADYLCGIGLVVMAVAAVGCGQASARPAQENPISPSALAENRLEVLWHTDMTLPTDPALRVLWSAGPYLVGCDIRNRIYVVDVATGVRRYSARVAETYQTVWQPAAYQDTLWVPTTTTLWGFRGKEGADAGHKKIAFAPSGGAVATAVQVFMPDVSGWLQSVATSTKYVSWNYWAGGHITASDALQPSVIDAPKDLSELGGNNYSVHGPDVKGWRGLDWGRWTDGMVTSRPVTDLRNVYFGGWDGWIYCSESALRHIVWKQKTEAPIVADLTRTKDGLVLAASLDYSLYAMTQSGRLAWQYPAGEPLHKKPFSTGNQVFVFSDEAGLTTLDVATGRIQWKRAEAADFLSTDADTLYVVSRDHQLMSVNRADGKVNFAIPIPAGVLWVANESDNGAVYLTTPSGRLMAIGKKGAPPILPPAGAKPSPGPDVKTTPTKPAP